ncbi:Alpha/Beta hydrolase protein [Chaetomium sp. MPI-SDFR-AT-0129]|nr:Alpha/Beta hydrolase protein [Chaetomium sp. MPI-SDFR-AT-0129]
MSLHHFGTLPPGVSTPPPTPFTINIPKTQQERLANLINDAEIAAPSFYNTHTDATDVSTSVGVSRDWLVNARDVWAGRGSNNGSEGGYSWEEEQKKLNRYPQFMADVNVEHNTGEKTEKETFHLHFAALFSRSPTATPILLLHGWPGAWFEFAPALDRLAAQYTPETLPYHVIVPSLPDFGFSTRDGVTERELSRELAAAALDGLMKGLGLGDGYVVQGGDLGAIIGPLVAAQFEGCKALHVNFSFLTPEQRESVANLTVKPEEQALVARAAVWGGRGRAYATMHSTRPSTIALVLGTNPLAMLAWMGEKFQEWSDTRYPVPLNTILSVVSYYWYTNSFGRAIWAYSPNGTIFPSVPSTKPFGYSSYPSEIMALPRSWAEKLFPTLVLYKQHDKASFLASDVSSRMSQGSE